MPARKPSPGDLEPIETASERELRALQLARLQATLRRAYDNVPHYRSAFDAAGVGPQDCRSLDDLARFPFTSKADLRDNYPFGMFAVPRTEVVRIHASSGTTGKPTVVGYTRNDIDTWATVMARSIRAAGGRAGDVVHVAYGYGLFTGGLGAHYGAEKLGCTVIPMSGGQTEKQVQLIGDFKPDIIMVTPSYMLAIAEEMERQGVDPQTGAVLAEGEKGELVFTSLTKEALPIIRYRTRDLTRLLPPTARSMRRMERITGRSDDMMIIRGVNVFPTQIEELILKQEALAPHYQLEITRPRALDELTVIVERAPGAGAADTDSAASALAHFIKSLIGVTAMVRVMPAGAIERSLGKAKRIIDKRAS
jgi:phenylacetate-coenzyme A ligase PaaK-like adenylate-forming protein